MTPRPVFGTIKTNWDSLIMLSGTDTVRYGLLSLAIVFCMECSCRSNRKRGPRLAATAAHNARILTHPEPYLHQLSLNAGNWGVHLTQVVRETVSQAVHLIKNAPPHHMVVT